MDGVDEESNSKYYLYIIFEIIIVKINFKKKNLVLSDLN